MVAFDLHDGVILNRELKHRNIPYDYKYFLQRC